MYVFYDLIIVVLDALTVLHISITELNRGLFQRRHIVVYAVAVVIPTPIVLEGLAGGKKLYSINQRWQFQKIKSRGLQTFDPECHTGYFQDFRGPKEQEHALAYMCTHACTPSPACRCARTHTTPTGTHAHTPQEMLHSAVVLGGLHIKHTELKTINIMVKTQNKDNQPTF